MKKLKAESDISWRRNGNKEQYKFNSELRENVSQAVWALGVNKAE